MKPIKHITKTIVAATIILLPSCSSSGNKNHQAEAEVINKEFAAGVNTQKPVFSSQNKELILSGKVEMLPDKVVYYTPLVSGVVERSYFALGDKVQQGQPLLDIRSSDLNAFQSEMISFEAEVKIAQRELQSVQVMFDNNLMSERALIEATAKLRQAQAAYEKAQNDMSLYVDRGQGVFAIKSPMSGYIVDKKATVGTPFSPDGAPIFTVADLSNVWIVANVYVGDLQFVKAGMPVEITTLAYPDQIFTGQIDALSQVFDPEERVLKARIAMPNKELTFKPEMFVVVRLKNQTDQNHLSIPSDALIFDDNQYFVVVEVLSGKFEIKAVQLQGHYQNTTYIRSGLDENDKVVTTNQLFIYSELKGK